MYLGSINVDVCNYLFRINNPLHPGYLVPPPRPAVVEHRQTLCARDDRIKLTITHMYKYG